MRIPIFILDELHQVSSLDIGAKYVDHIYQLIADDVLCPAGLDRLLLEPSLPEFITALIFT